MKKQTEIILSKEDIANEGIEVKLTQADVIDMLVEEQLGEIKNIFETLKETSIALGKEIEKEYEEYIDSVVAKQPVPKGLKVSTRDVSSYRNKGKNVNLYTLKEYVDSRNNITYSIRTRSIDEGCEGQIKIYYQGTISGIEMGGWGEPIFFKFKHSKKLIALVEETKEKAEEFLKMIPIKGFNEKELAKKIKNQFTKEILKTSSAEFRKKLKEGFGTNI
jgi:hypothetical protein